MKFEDHPFIGRRCTIKEDDDIYTILSVRRGRLVVAPYSYYLSFELSGKYFRRWLGLGDFTLLPETNQKNMKKPHPHIGRKCTVEGRKGNYEVVAVHSSITYRDPELFYDVIDPQGKILGPFYSSSITLLPEAGLDPKQSRLRDLCASLDWSDITLAENVHVKLRTWIRIDKTRLDYNWIRERKDVIKNLDYTIHDNSIDYDLMQEDGSWKHISIILPDSAEVTIGRTVDN